VARQKNLTRSDGTTDWTGRDNIVGPPNCPVGYETRLAAPNRLRPDLKLTCRWPENERQSNVSVYVDPTRSSLRRRRQFTGVDCKYYCSNYNGKAAIKCALGSFGSLVTHAEPIISTFTTRPARLVDIENQLTHSYKAMLIIVLVQCAGYKRAI